jgi:hypothetical protein
MQLSAAVDDEKEGLIFARGDLSSSIYASFARSQMEYGSSSTFGLEVVRNRAQYDPETDEGKRGSSFRLGRMLQRGCFNYRWPLNEYALHLNGEKTKAERRQSNARGAATDFKGEHQQASGEGPQQHDRETGTCTTLSFMRQGICYQVLRIQQGCGPDAPSCELFPPSSQIVLGIGGSIQLRSWETIGDRDKTTTAEGKPTSTAFKDESTSTKMRFIDTDTGIGLEAQVWKVKADAKPCYEPLELTKDDISNPVNESRSQDGRPNPGPYNAYVPLRGERRAVFVAALRLFKVTTKDKEGKFKLCDLPMLDPPRPDVIYKYITLGKDIDAPGKETGRTGLMWTSIFLRRHLHTGSVPEPTEVSLLGRCLEKILQVDLVPRTKRGYSTVVSNNFVEPSIDLRALL